MNGDLFAAYGAGESRPQRLGAGTVLLHGFATTMATTLLADLQQVIERAPFRHMRTAGGFRMSVAMSNCGRLGWLSDEAAYRYDPIDPHSACPWPPLPQSFLRLARMAAADAGFPGFEPDACLINRYRLGSRLSLHQDRNERDFSAPIVSVSLGLPAVFLLGGMRRAAPTIPVGLNHGDVLVWGGPDRLRYHGVRPLKAGDHPLLGDQRINLTFRRAA